MTTDAGRALAVRLVGQQRDYYHLEEAIAAIEAEAAQRAVNELLTPARVAAALGRTGNCGHSSCPRDTSRHLDEAAAIIAELRRPAKTPPRRYCAICGLPIQDTFAPGLLPSHDGVLVDGVLVHRICAGRAP